MITYIAPRSRAIAIGLALGISSTAFSATIAELTGGYDVLVKDNATFNGVHIHGATAIGGNLTLTGNMSEFLMDAVSRPAGLTVTGTIAQNADARIVRTGRLHVGSLQPDQTVVSAPGSNYLKSGNTGKSLYLEPNGGQTATDVLSPAAVDIVASFSRLSALSASLAALDSTLDFNSYVSGSNFIFTLGTGSSGSFDVMNITGSQLASVQNLNFGQVANADQTLVINVDLSSYGGGDFVQNRNGNSEADHIIWNFYGSSTLGLQNQFIGTILAPDIALTHTNNDIKGSVIAGSFTKNGGQVHVHQPSYDFPNDPPPSNRVPDTGSTGFLALLIAPLFAGLRRWLR